MQYAVYALSDTLDTPIRYIGVTGKPVDVRLTVHLAKAVRVEKPSPLQAWLLSLAARPHIHTLAMIDGRAEARETEQTAIAAARAAGGDLLNRNRGGSLVDGFTRTDGAAIGEASRTRWALHRDEMIAKQNAGKARPEARARKRRAAAEVWARTGMRRHQCLAHAIKLGAEDVRAIKHALARGDSQTGIAKRYGVASSHISRIKTGRSWRHITVKSGPAGGVGYVGF